MVAPSLSLNRIVSTFSGFSQSNLVSNLSNFLVPGYTADGNRLILGGGFAELGEYFLEVIFPGGPIDATNTEWHVFAYFVGQSRNIRFGLGSGANNRRVWNNTGISAHFRQVDLIVSTNIPTSIPDVGTYNPTAVDRLRLEFTTSIAGSSSEIVGFFGIPFYWDASSGMAIVGGDTTTPLSFGQLLALRTAHINNFPFSAQVTFTNGLFGTDLIQFAAPIVFGNSTTTKVSDRGLVSFTFTEGNTSATAFTDINLPSTRYINGYSSLSPQGYIFRSAAVPYSWEEIGTNNNWGRLTIENPTTVELGLSNYINGLINGATGLSSGGKLVGIEWKNCTNSIVYEWRQNSDNSYPDLSGSKFDSPGASYYIDIPSTLNTITFDAREITFNSYSGVKFFRTNVPLGHTVTIQVVAASGIALSDVQQDGAGTTVIETPQPTLTLTNLVAGSTIRVQNTTDNVELYNLVEVTTEWSGSVPGGKGLLIRVRKATGSPEYKPLQTSFVAGISTDQTVVINQELDT